MKIQSSRCDNKNSIKRKAEPEKWKRNLTKKERYVKCN